MAEIEKYLQDCNRERKAVTAWDIIDAFNLYKGDDDISPQIVDYII